MEGSECCESGGGGFTFFMYEITLHRNLKILLILLFFLMLTAVILWFYFRDATWWFLGWNTNREKRKMAKEDVQKCLEWLLNEQADLENSSFGFCKAGVGDASTRHRSRSSDVMKYRSNIQRLMTRHRITESDAKEISQAYESVKSLASKKESCLEVLQGITSLEQQIQSMASEFDVKAMHLVNLQENNKQNGSTTLSNESLAKTAQNCNVAVRGNWRWMSSLLECSHVHLLNAAAYHQFFHEVEEVEYWMNITLSRIHLTFDRSKLNGERSDVEMISDEMKDMLLAYLQWQGKVEALFDRSKDVVSVPQRIEPIKEPRPVIALCSYRTNEMEFFEGDALTLLDNSKRESWLVENSRGQSCNVPPVILLIPGPSGRAVDAAMKLRVQLLALWTTSIKRLGYQMIAFMTLMFRDWTDAEIRMFQSMSEKEKADLERVLKHIEESLEKNWSGYSDYQNLEEKILQLRMILEGESVRPANKQETKESSKLVIQIKSLENLLNKYKDFWTYWETFKVIVELVKEPKHLLVCDKWDQLRYVTTAHFVKFWDTTLDLELEDLAKGGMSITLHEKPKEPLEKPLKKADEVLMQDVQDIQVCEVQPLQLAAEGVTEMTEDDYETVDAHETTTELTADEISSTVEEERSTFIITAVSDPRQEEDLTPQEAIAKGILDQAGGKYNNPVTGEVMSIAEAMNEGYIMVEFTSRKKIRQEEKSFGVLTIKTTKENRPFTIKKVMNPKTDEELSVSQATEQGIINTKNNTYKTETGEFISLYDAIYSGLVKADFENGGSHTPEAEVVTKTYAVHGVVDQKRKQKISFSNAINKGLLDRDSGEYVNNLTGERIAVTDAIMKGFIKARVVTDTSKLDLDPEKSMVIEKFASTQNKVLAKLKVAKAFKGALNGN